MNTRSLAAIAASLLVSALGLPMPAHGASVPECTNADLTASYHGGDAAMSHVYGRIVLTNSGDHACVTGGYGGLSYVGGGNGAQVGAAADREKRTVRLYVLQPGERVHSRVVETSFGVYSTGECRPEHVDGFRVYVPDATAAQFVPHPTTGCADAEVHLVSHRPYRR